MMLALPTMFDPARAHGVDATYGIRLGEHAFRVRVEGGELDLARGGADEADAVIATDTSTLPELLWRDLQVEQAEDAGTLRSKAAAKARRFLGLFRPRTRVSRPEPGGQRLGEPLPASVFHPRHMAVGPDQHRGRGGDLAEHRKLPRAGVLGVDRPGPGPPTARRRTAPGSPRFSNTGRASCSRANTRSGPPAVPRSRSGIRRPTKGCPAPRS